mgnify:CR=1 FL=1
MALAVDARAQGCGVCVVSRRTLRRNPTGVKLYQPPPQQISLHPLAQLDVLVA